MTDMMDLNRRLQAIDPLDPAADLDPHGPTAHRVRTAAVATPTPAPRRARRPRALRPALAAGAVAALAVVALAAGLPGGSDHPAGPADARAALLSAAERTAAFTSGHVRWEMRYDNAAFDLASSDDVRFEGSDVAVDWRSTLRRAPGATPGEHHGGSRIVGGRAYSQDGENPYRPSPDPHHGADAPAEVLVRIQAADALAAATRAAGDVRATPADDGATRYAATVAAADVPDQFAPPFRRTAAGVAITAVVGEDGAVRSLALRAPGEAVDVSFADLGAPQGIVAP
jgi:hypothetical protein